jgi:hypothetical protein
MIHKNPLEIILSNKDISSVKDIDRLAIKYLQDKLYKYPLFKLVIGYTQWAYSEDPIKGIILYLYVYYGMALNPKRENLRGN